MSETVEPRPVVKLTGTDGNAFAVLGLTKNALRKAGASQEHVAKFMTEAMSGDYDHLLATVMEYVEVE